MGMWSCGAILTYRLPQRHGQLHHNARLLDVQARRRKRNEGHPNTEAEPARINPHRPIAASVFHFRQRHSPSIFWLPSVDLAELLPVLEQLEPVSPLT
jgi:hypothetical protein